MAALWLVVAPTPASATVMRHASLEDLVEVSDRIVRARVESRRSFVRGDEGDNDDDGNRIVTHTELAVSRSYLGSSRASDNASDKASNNASDKQASRLVVEQWGGTVGERTQVIPGDATFADGEEVLVFLRRIPGRDVFALAALAQSKYSLETRRGVLWAERDLSELAFAVSSSEDEESEANGARPDRLLKIDGMPRRFSVLEERLLELLSRESRSRAGERRSGDVQ